MIRFLRALLALTTPCLAFAPAAADVYLSEGTNISVDIAPDGRLVTDLLGGLWTIPAGGGDATAIPTGLRSLRQPRFSPEGERILFQSETDGVPGLWIHDLGTNETLKLGNPDFVNRHPAWHPDGTKIVFSSGRNDTGYDIWELDVATGLSWRLTELAGDESEPAWSDNGEHLVFVNQDVNGWSIVLRLKGQADEELVRSDEPLAAPSWRPDGSLVTWLQMDEGKWSVKMSILSQPRLQRELIDGEDLFLSPIAWRDRQHMIYAANGKLRQREFNSWHSENLPFRANVGSLSGHTAVPATIRQLRDLAGTAGRRVIRADRIYDGLGASYADESEVVLEQGRITGVQPRREHDDSIVIDMGDATILPGFIDAYARLPETVDPSLGPKLLSLGVTTLVSRHPRSADVSASWSDPSMPGPRVLPASTLDDAPGEEPWPWLITVSSETAAGGDARADVRRWQDRGVAVLAESWQAGLSSGASLLLGTNTRPASPQGFHYQDVQLASGVGSVTFVSGLADMTTPGLADIWEARGARLIAPEPSVTRRFADAPSLSLASPLLIVGSQPNGLPPGIALHAELRALKNAGLREEQVLRAAGVNAAAALGLGSRLGRLAPGAAADLVIVGGDPLSDIRATLNVIAVVRNGHFYSVSGLLDRVDVAQSSKNLTNDTPEPVASP